MDTTALKKFSQAARTLLIAQVASKLDLVLDETSAARRESPKAVKELEAAVRRANREQVIERVAYTWFNRFTALRFMDANGYTQVGTVSPTEGQTRPELLSEAMAGNLPEGAPEGIAALLDGRAPSNDPQAEAYQLLLVYACNQWHGPMPYLFEKIDDYSELLMPEDLLSPSSILAELRKVMTAEACADVEIIGWLYQFYISEKKDAVFAGLKKNVKITAENIPAATQLFTPHWIVRYLVENSLGRLWLLNRPDSKLAERMDYYIAPEEAETDFLVVERPEDIRICDPAAGSGHMLTYAFDLLYAIYEEEGYEPTAIPALILTHNLTGVEIDDRAGALAAFALTMKAAAKLGRRRFTRMGVTPEICVLENVSFTEAEVQDVAAMVGKDLFTHELRETLGQFEQAKNFGSLIVPKLRDPAETLRMVEAWDSAGDLLSKDVQTRVVAVLRMAEALSPKYHVALANPPYLGSKGMNRELEAFAKQSYPSSKTDLYSMFIERGLSFCVPGGIAALITMQSWMFITTFSDFRRKLLSGGAILSMLHLGERAFDTIGGAVVSTTAFVIGRKFDPDLQTVYIRATDGGNEQEKIGIIKQSVSERSGDFWFSKRQSELEKIPGKPLSYWISSSLLNALNAQDALSERAVKGLDTNGDIERFLKRWTEVSSDKFSITAPASDHWYPLAKGGEFRRWYGNNDFAINYAADGADLKGNKANLRSSNRYFIEGLTWTVVSTSGFAVRVLPSGFLFDQGGSAIHLFDGDTYDFGDLAGSLNSRFGSFVAKLICPTLNFTTGDVRKFPIWKSPALSKNSLRCIALSTSDWNAYETSWDFTTLPLLQSDYRAETLEASYAALRKHWQSMIDEMQRLEEENNRIFIDAYGLADEMTPDVPLNEITLTCNSAYRYGGNATVDEREERLRRDTVAEFLHYAVGCMFGRYSLDEPGLILANVGERLDAYTARVPDPTFMPDADNVIPILDGDWFADDITDRFRAFLETTFGEENFRENLAFIETALGKPLRKYFTKDFYADHVKRYKKRPIYWMFSSPKGTFNALIYMHRYRPDTASTLLNEYLREFITKLEGERTRLEKLSDDDSATQGQQTKALKDIGAVTKQLEELKAWERDVIFPLAQKKIEIDLDDGVKHNYPLFDEALKKITGLSA